MNNSTKLAIEMITGSNHYSEPIKHIYSSREIRTLFFNHFVGPERECTPHEELTVLGVEMRDVNWEKVFDVVVLDNITIECHNFNRVYALFSITITMKD